MPRKVRSVFQQPRAHGVGPASWSSSVGKATQTWRNKKKPPTRKGWKPYDS